MPYADPDIARIHHVWRGMKQRCYNPSHTNYYNYGGRGITICQEWLTNSQAFTQWALVNGYAADLTIERLDVDGNYTPDNCTWITQHDQSRHRRNNRLLTAFGETKCLRDWSIDPRCQVRHAGLLKRIQKGMDAETAITNPPEKDWRKDPSERTCLKCGLTKSRDKFYLRSRPIGQRYEDLCNECFRKINAPPQKVTEHHALITAFGESKLQSEWARDPRCKVKQTNLSKRLARGMDPEEAMTKPSRKAEH
jgi:hypothetical protein